eukprot:7864530-Lingulodinium_polyedra.AAC.1
MRCTVFGGTPARFSSRADLRKGLVAEECADLVPGGPPSGPSTLLPQRCQTQKVFQSELTV